MVPSTLHQCIKYQRDGIEQTIPGDIQPFSIHEVGIYEDAVYYAPNKNRNPTTNIKITKVQEDEKKNESKEKGKELPKENKKFQNVLNRTPNTSQRGGRKTNKARGRRNNVIERKVPLKIELESSSEEEKEILNLKRVPFNYNKINPPERYVILYESDSDDEIIYQVHNKLSNENEASSSIMFNELKHDSSLLSLTPPLDITIEELIIEDSPLPEEESLKIQTCDMFEALIPEEDVRLEALNHNDKVKVNSDYLGLSKNFREKQSLNELSWTKSQAKANEKLWKSKPDSNSHQGLGFRNEDSSDDDGFCYMISNHLEADALFTDSSDPLEEVWCGDTGNLEDLQIGDAPPEFEEEIKTTVDELKEINLGTEENPRPTFISSLLEEEESNNLVKLLSKFKDCFA
ncbi:hypothetical protein EE071_28435, partial [Klebsiella pneumoniae]|nr:hypothetical protein [Klebsiella pneumoniae]